MLKKNPIYSPQSKVTQNELYLKRPGGVEYQNKGVIFSQNNSCLCQKVQRKSDVRVCCENQAPHFKGESTPLPSPSNFTSNVVNF